MSLQMGVVIFLLGAIMLYFVIKNIMERHKLNKSIEAVALRFGIEDWKENYKKYAK